jgi:hypothetical protein
MRQPARDLSSTPGGEPAEGRSDMGLPGADRDDITEDRRPGGAPDPGATPSPGHEPPDTPDADLPERLGDRVANGPGPGIASGEPDLVPDVEVPEETM